MCLCLSVWSDFIRTNSKRCVAKELPRFLTANRHALSVLRAMLSVLGGVSGMQMLLLLLLLLLLHTQ